MHGSVNWEISLTYSPSTTYHLDIPGTCLDQSQASKNILMDYKRIITFAALLIHVKCYREGDNNCNLRL